MVSLLKPDTHSADRVGGIQSDWGETKDSLIKAGVNVWNTERRWRGRRVNVCKVNCGHVNA